MRTSHLTLTLSRKNLGTLVGSLAVSVLVMGATMADANAATIRTITQTFQVNPTTTNWTKNLSFNLFDTRLGTLDNVRLVLNGTVMGTGSLRNNNSTAVTRGTYSLSALISLSTNTGAALTSVQPIYSDAFNTLATSNPASNRIAANSTRWYGSNIQTLSNSSPAPALSPLSRTLNSTQNYSSGNPLLSYFSRSGGGTGSIVANALGQSRWINGPSNTAASFSTSASATYTLTYTYTAVPEPMTILGAGTAVALGAAFKRRKDQKKS